MQCFRPQRNESRTNHFVFDFENHRISATTKEKPNQMNIFEKKVEERGDNAIIGTE